MKIIFLSLSISLHQKNLWNIMVKTDTLKNVKCTHIHNKTKMPKQTKKHKSKTWRMFSVGQLLPRMWLINPVTLHWRNLFPASQQGPIANIFLIRSRNLCKHPFSLLWFCVLWICACLIGAATVFMSYVYQSCFV